MPFVGHWWEFLIVLIVALLIFGPKRLPEMGSAVGKTIKEFQRSMKENLNSPETPTPTSTDHQIPPAQTVPQVTGETHPEA